MINRFDADPDSSEYGRLCGAGNVVLIIGGILVSKVVAGLFGNVHPSMQRPNETGGFGSGQWSSLDFFEPTQTTQAVADQPPFTSS
jgi:Flp pilus assembly pilin Flp